MTVNKTQIFSVFTLLLALSWLMAACSSSSTPVIPNELTTAPAGSAPSPSATEPTPPNPPVATPTQEAHAVFLSEPLPANLFKIETLADDLISEDPEAPLWFGVLEEAPNGEMLHFTDWIYALVAPFPTLIDDIAISQLQAFWQGNPEGDFVGIARLYVPQSLSPVLTLRWGNPDPDTTAIVGEVPDPDSLWNENAWAILPFDALNPKLKVISIEASSPLFKDFNPADYPLTVRYALIQNETVNESISSDAIETLIKAITPTNRDTDKMTTLVMTGVTALVRATAHKMEINGILYPGEKIVHWLSEADLTHISNEVSFYENCPFPDPNSRMLLFCSNPEYIKLLEYVGADIIELTGNHNNDTFYVNGKDVVPFTLDLYQERGMVYFGGGHDLAEAMSPATLTHHGNRLAFIGCNAPGPDFAWATEDHGGAAPCGDFQWMADEISRLKNEGFLPIATFQYYEDYYNFAEEHHRRDFGRMADAGAVIVNGSQAHRPKGMAFREDAFIDYGLGNLFFDQMGIIDDYGNQILQTRWEIIQRHTFYDGRHLSTELLTAMLEDYAQPRPMTEQERAVFLEELFTASGWNPR